MKKLTFVLIVILLFFDNAKACDICGCGVGSNYVGLLPEFKKYIVGTRYRYNSITTNLGIDGLPTYLTNYERYATAEIWGGFNLTKKLRLLAFVPYNFNSRTNETNGIKHKNGLGDITTLFYYELLNNKKALANSKLLVNTFWLGGGVKLPTGNYISTDKNIVNSNNLFQLGTGSVDYSVVAMYDLRYQDIGVNMNAVYRLNGSNKYHYKYGNKVTIASQLYHKFKLSNTASIAPNIGYIYESSSKDVDSNEQVDISGGNVNMGTFGFEANYNKISIGFNWQTPLAQNLAGGVVKANSRVMLHCSVTL